MTGEEFLRELADVLDAAPEDLSPDAALETLPGWDSVGLLGVIALLDGLGGEPMDVAQLQLCQKVQDVIDLAGDRLG